MHLRRARDHIDRHYADRSTSTRLAAVAGVSKYHFVRCFEATYGETPIRYLTRRRIERAQDLLRAANLTVTEVCMLVGFSSLGSFSSRFTRAGRREPDGVPRPLGGPGRRRTCPGCYLFMRGVLDPAAPPATASRIAQSRRSPPADRRLAFDDMITNISLVTVYCLDQDKARDFYVDVLGFEPGTDVTMGEGFRWVTVGAPEPAGARGHADDARPAAGRRRRRLHPPPAGEGRRWAASA